MTPIEKQLLKKVEQMEKDIKTILDIVDVTGKKAPATKTPTKSTKK